MERDEPSSDCYHPATKINTCGDCRPTHTTHDVIIEHVLGARTAAAPSPQMPSDITLPLILFLPARAASSNPLPFDSPALPPLPFCPAALPLSLSLSPADQPCTEGPRPTAAGAGWQHDCQPAQPAACKAPCLPGCCTAAPRPGEPCSLSRGCHQGGNVTLHRAAHHLICANNLGATHLSRQWR